MKYVLRIRAAARRDVAESHSWYVARSPAAAERFMAELDVLFGALAENPMMFPEVYGEVRRALMRHFPYAVYFVLHSHRIAVLRVLHQARDPREWRPA
jgi:plasmid stabilization system protein ParE